MIDYNKQRELWGQLSLNNAIPNLDLGDELISNETKRIVHAQDWTFTKGYFDITPTTNIIYALPGDYYKSRVVMAINGSTKKPVMEFTDRMHFDERTQDTNATQTYPYGYIIEGTNIEFMSKIDSNTTIRVYYKKKQNDVTPVNPSILPEEYRMMPIYGALHDYFVSIKKDVQRADRYDAKYQKLMKDLRRDYLSDSTDPALSHKKVTMYEQPYDVTA